MHWFVVVRQEFFRLHQNVSDVRIQVGRWSLADMRESTFCLCPSGVGFGWRVFLALAALCIPVIIQPGVKQAYSDLLPYHEFSLEFGMSEVKRLPELLRAISQERVCVLRQNAARYYRAFMWQEPTGLAYDLLQLSLCRRAWRVFQQRSAVGATGLGHNVEPPWAACARATVEQLFSLEQANG